MSQESKRAALRPLTQDEFDRLFRIRDGLWKEHDNDDKCKLQDGKKLSREDWDWLLSLKTGQALHTEIASGFTTPNPFVLIFDAADTPGLLMVHPLHVPSDLGEEAEAKTLLRIFL